MKQYCSEPASVRYHTRLIKLIAELHWDKELLRCQLEDWLNSDEAECYSLKELQQTIKEARNGTWI